MPTKEDVSLNKVDLLLKSYSRIQIIFQALIKIGWGCLHSTGYLIGMSFN